MENTWITLTEETLPEPNILVWVKRVDGGIYLAYRTASPLSIDIDASRNCHWYGGHLMSVVRVEYFREIQFDSNFSDVTVEAWQEIKAPTF
jgi:hypothetical protein